MSADAWFETTLAERRRSLEDVPTDEVLGLAFIFGNTYKDRLDFNFYAVVWAERISEGRTT